MKPILSTALMFLLLGTSASTFARQDKGQDRGPDKGQAQHSQEAKPQPQQRQQARPVQHQQTQNARPAQQSSRTQQHNAPAVHQQTQTQARAQQPSGRNNGGYAHGRISNARYSASFGSGHSFHVNRGDYDHRRFQYGGYSFGFVDPWPVAWGYSDDVYVVYADGGYYMYDRVHPGVRISVNIF